MAYTSGVFRIDLVSGSDTARTALTSCTAANPSGTITRITKTAHGLVTGAVVDLTLFSSWLNDAWKITKVDNDNFDLDGAVWQATADASGTVTPRGGSSWTDAWLTVNSGATAARIQPGDEIRFAKTADPVSLGQNATWTDGSQTVTLTSAVTKKIEDAITGWTGATNITVATNTSRKLGATSTQLTPAAGFTTGKMAYKAIAGGGTQDFSAYQYINLWFRSNSNVAYNSGDFKICLCSDATGDVIVNEINIPAILANSNWVSLSLSYGGNLSASVQSVAIYANVDPSTNVISLNNIFASAGDLSLKTLIGKTGDVNYCIQSIDGTTIKIDSNSTTASGRGYSGSTSTETLYYRVPFDVSTSGTWASINEAGNALNAFNHYIGGYNTSNDTRDGVTAIASTIVGIGSAFSLMAFSKISYFSIFRCGTLSTSTPFALDNVVFGGGGTVVGATNSEAVFTSCKFLNSSATFYCYGSKNDFIQCEFRSNTNSGIQAATGNRFVSCTFANNGTSGIVASDSVDYGTGSILCRNCTMSDSTEVTFSTNKYPIVWSFDHDNTQGNHYGFTSGATINRQSGTVHLSEPVAWKVAISSSNRSAYRPVTMKIADVACAASALVTVKAWVKKDHATNVACKIYVEDALYSIDGVSATSATKASDTSWEELTITFTPTEAGVVPILFDTWYVAGNSNTYVGTVTITQA